MVDEPDTVVLICLRRLDAKRDRIIDDLADAKVRFTNLEEGQAVLSRRMDRIEAPLGLVDLPH